LQKISTQTALFVDTDAGRNIRFILKETLPEFDASLTCAGNTGSGCAHRSLNSSVLQ
jgi:hypothetical protein